MTIEMGLWTALGEGVGWGQVLAAGIAVVAGVVLGLAVRWIVGAVARRREHQARSIVIILARLALVAVVAIGTYIGLRIIGFDPAPLIAGAGVVGITLAFALRDIVENYVSGILIGLRSPFRPGDQIVSGEHEGTVEDLNLRYTTLRTYDGVRVLLPNGSVLQNPLTNLTVNGVRRTDVSVGVAYGTELETARSVLIDAVAGVDGVDPEHEVQAWVESLDASWITIRVRFWHAPRIADMWRMRSRVLVAVVAATDAAGIELPFETWSILPSSAAASSTVESEPRSRADG